MIIFNNCLDSPVTINELDLLWRRIPSDQSLVVVVSGLLNFSHSGDKLPDVWMYHSELTLYLPVSRFRKIVSLGLVIDNSVVAAP